MGSGIRWCWLRLCRSWLCCSCCYCCRPPCSCCSPCCQLRQRLPLCLSHHPRSCPCCHPCHRRSLRRCWTVCRQLCWSCPRCLRRFLGYFVCSTFNKSKLQKK